MKKLFIFFVPVAMLFASCRSNDSAILGTRYDTTGFHTVEDHTQIGEILHPGDTVWAHTVPTVVTVYHVQANSAEQWHYAWVHGDVWLLILGAVVLSVGAAWFIRSNNNNQNTKSKGIGQASVAVLIVVLCIGCGIIGTSLGWWAGYSADIDKPTYDLQMQQHGNLNLWFHNRLK